MRDWLKGSEGLSLQPNCEKKSLTDCIQRSSISHVSFIFCHMAFPNLLTPTSHTLLFKFYCSFYLHQTYWLPEVMKQQPQSIQSQSTNSLRRCNDRYHEGVFQSFLNSKGQNQRIWLSSLVSLLGPGLKTQRRKSTDFIFAVQHTAGMANKWRWVENKSFSDTHKRKRKLSLWDNDETPQVENIRDVQLIWTCCRYLLQL